ncbi:MAG: SDR family NAD(P)-dependent oxidoreductase, partial [Rhodoglobus sp.]
MKIAGCSALVTGGASGLGLATALRLAADGARVVIADLPSSRGAELAADHGFVFVPADVTDSTDMARAVETASELAPLRIAVCCAGVATAERAVGRE